jgi:hypothetical protein
VIFLIAFVIVSAIVAFLAVPDPLTRRCGVDGWARSSLPSSEASTGCYEPVAGNVVSHGIAFADLAGGWVMILGRFVPILAALALAGSLGPRRIAPPGLGTLRTDTPTFVIYLIGFVIIFAVLTFLTVLMIVPFAQALTSRALS